MSVAPWRLNAAIAVLFMIGSACFALGTIPWYVNAVGDVPDAITFFVGSIFFTAASFAQLLQAQSPAMVPPPDGDDRTRRVVVLRAWVPHDRGWLAAATQFPGTLAFNASTAFAIATTLTETQTHRLVWVPDFVGSILFLVSSAFAILALGSLLELEPGSLAWEISWLNMIGSVFFMVSAIASYVLPGSSQAVDPRWANLGTFLGALCFFAGAGLMLPEWTHAVRRARAGSAPDDGAVASARGA
jgi:hypothetical protein